MGEIKPTDRYWASAKRPERVEANRTIAVTNERNIAVIPEESQEDRSHLTKVYMPSRDMSKNRSSRSRVPCPAETPPNPLFGNRRGLIAPDFDLETVQRQRFEALMGAIDAGIVPDDSA